MLEIIVDERELFDDEKQEFIYLKKQTLKLEFSLIAISKWESKWCKPFFSVKDKTGEQMLDFIRCMTINHVDPLTYICLSKQNIEDIDSYMNLPYSATIIYESNETSKTGEQVTSELIYYWMVALNIPFECEKWNIKRLLKLVKICNIKNQPPKKLSPEQIAMRNHNLNEERKAKLNSKG